MYHKCIGASKTGFSLVLPELVANVGLLVHLGTVCLDLESINLAHIL